MTKYFVSRQHYYYSGDLVVEIAGGGLDYSGADMLTPRYRNLGEGGEYTNPVEAGEVAITICEQWRRDCPEEEINVVAGFSHGFTAEFEPSDFAAIREEMKAALEEMPKCDYCGGVIYEGEGWRLVDEPDLEFCSRYCTEEFEGGFSLESL